MSAQEKEQTSKEALHQIDEDIQHQQMIEEETLKQESLNPKELYKQSIQNDVNNQCSSLRVFWSVDDVFNQYNYQEIREKVVEQIIEQNNIYMHLIDSKKSFGTDELFN